MGSSAFAECASLTAITIPEGVTNIGQYAFADCISLTNISIPSSVTSLGYRAFYGCDKLACVTIAPGVTSLGDGVFQFCASLKSILLPASITAVGSNAFASSKLTSIYFSGNAPSIGTEAFSGLTTVYYLPGTSGWSSTFGGRPALLWNPMFKTDGPDFGVSANRFGFNIAGTPNIPVLLEACTDLAHPAWQPLRNFWLTNGSVYLSDLAWTNYPSRIYRIRSP